MNKITCQIPHQYLTKKMENIILEILLKLEKRIMINIQLKKIDDYDLSPSNYNIKKNQIEIRGLYDGIFYENEYHYSPIFKINLKSNYRYIISKNKSDVKSIRDFNGKTIHAYLLSEMDYLHPIVDYFKDHCILESYFSSKLITNHNDVIEKLHHRIDYLIIGYEDYHSLDNNIKKDLSVIAKYSKIPGLMCMQPQEFSGIKIDDFQDTLSTIDFFNSDFVKHFEFKIDDLEKKGHQLIVEALDQYPNGFYHQRNNKQNRMINALTFREKLKSKETEVSFDSASIFSDRMVKMYREVKNDYNDLSKTLNAISDNLILFSTDGKIHGVSKSFYEYFNLKRDDILNDTIFNIFYPDTSAKLSDMIKQVEFGLIKSFYVNVKFGSISKKEKIEFNVMEFIDTRLILGKIIK